MGPRNRTRRWIRYGWLDVGFALTKAPGYCARTGLWRLLRCHLMDMIDERRTLQSEMVQIVSCTKLLSGSLSSLLNKYCRQPSFLALQ